MASNMKVKVHPVVYMTIVDSYMRRAKSNLRNVSSDKAFGTLMGFYEKDAIQVTNCFAIPFNDNTENLELDDQFNQQMINTLKKATPTEQPVGWFITSADLTANCLVYHDYYMRIINETARKETPPIVVLTLDTSLAGQNKTRMPVRAYIRSKAGIPGGVAAHCAIFNPLKVELDAYPGECVAMQLIENALDSKRREATLESGLQQLEHSTGDMINWLERMLTYVDNVVENGEGPGDATLGRNLMEVVNTAASHMQPEKLDALVKNTLRDYMMVSYLANLTKTQLQIHEGLVSN